jgi:hypothetical protein
MAEARQRGAARAQRSELQECPWHNIEQPGAYVDLDTGDLYRIPRAALLQGAAPLIRRESGGAGRLVCISPDPWVTTLAARWICYAHNITPNF